MSVEAISAARKLKLPPRDKFVLIALADYANDKGEAWPGQSTLSEWTSYDRSTVNAALTALEKAGIITSRQTYRDDGGKSTKVYRLAFLATPHVAHANKGHVGESNNPHVGESNNPHVGESNKGMLATPTTPCGPQQQPHVAQANSKNRQEGTTNKEPPKSNRAREKFDPSKIVLPTYVSPDAWTDFVDHRRKLKKILTERAVELILADLAKTPLDADEMLRTSIKRGWTGVFPLDRNRARGSPTNDRAADDPAFAQYTERGL